jgi:NAD(P)-dependent dehydrogenase (short-subunit alcohol dehydrogenase family)
MDIGRSEDAQRTAQSAIDAFGRLDILINCAAIRGSLKPILETTESDWQEVLHTNVIGTFLLTQASIRQMLVQGWGGAVVNVLAIQAVMPLPDHGPYAASRGALSSFTRSLAVELAGKGIRVNGIAVGSIYTDSAKNALAKPGDHDSSPATETPEEIDSSAGTLVGRMGRPDDIASVALFLASEDASYLAGAIIPAEGGRLISRKSDPFVFAQQARNASDTSRNSK